MKPHTRQNPKQRLVVLTEGRKLKMARSAHAYVRGSTEKFYEWLESEPGIALPKGPAVWICGDCHLGNLGPVASAEGRIQIQIRDLDQTVIGNPAHDLVRLALSLAMASRGSNLSGTITAAMLESMIAGYEAGLSKTVDEDDAPEPIEDILKRAFHRRWRHLAEERIKDVTPSIPLGKNFWALTAAEKKALADIFEAPETRKLVTALKDRKDEAPFKILDAAYWVKGCSSLGRLRYAVLLGVGKHKDREFCLVDIKEGVAAAAPRYEKTGMPRDNAKRVVEGARNLSPYLGERMLAARFMGKAVILRELLPQDLKLELERIDKDEAIATALFLAAVVGKAHGRQLDPPAKKAWLSDLSRCRTKNLDAPSWLWNSVVELVSSHEAAYLQHCRSLSDTMVG